MALIDLWENDRQQILSKRVNQLIAFAGEGRLGDANTTCREFRELLAVVPSDVLESWILQSLGEKFSDFGFVLQDVVNEIGRRLNFDVQFGVYRSHAEQSFDGFWQTEDGIAILVECKSSTNYRINLSRIADYRIKIAQQNGLSVDSISVLLVVGEPETGELEAQVRGSRHAWSVRLIGLQSLLRLLRIKEALDDDGVERQIRDLLVPQEFTRLDSIIDIVFATAEDVKTESGIDEAPPGEVEEIDATPRANFGLQIIPMLEKKFGKSLIRKSRILWASPDEALLVSCQVSKRHGRSGNTYWYGLKTRTKLQLERHPHAFCAFGLGSAEKVVLLPYSTVADYLSGFSVSTDSIGGIIHWHVKFRERDGATHLLTEGERGSVIVDSHLLAVSQGPST